MTRDNLSGLDRQWCPLCGRSRGPLRSLAAQHDIRLRSRGVRRAELFVDRTLDLVDEVQWSDPEAVSAAVADFDIGLYPLIENQFNIYKVRVQGARVYGHIHSRGGQAIVAPMAM